MHCYFCGGMGTPTGGSLSISSLGKHLSLCYCFIWKSTGLTGVNRGFGTGIAQSAVFISLQAVIDPAHIAPAISVLYLSGTVAMIIGLASVSAVMQQTLKVGLSRRLIDLDLDPVQREKVSNNVISEPSSILIPHVKDFIRGYIECRIRLQGQRRDKGGRRRSLCRRSLVEPWYFDLPPSPLSTLLISW